MPWDHSHYDRAYAAFLTSGDDEGFCPPAAVFRSKTDAEEYILAERVKALKDDDPVGYLEGLPDGPRPENYLRDASILEVRNCFVPFWNDCDEVPDENPSPVPDYAAHEALRSLEPSEDAGEAVLRAIDRELGDLEAKSKELLNLRKAVTG